jgi:tripartite motif-containing protein 71
MMSRLSRRTFLHLTTGAAALAGLTASGCGDSETYVFTNTQPQAAGGPEVLGLEDQLMAFGPEGAIYRLDFATFRVARLAADGSVIWEVGGLGAGDGLFNYPIALSTDAAGLVYVADRGNGEIDLLDPANGALLRTFGSDLLDTARGMDIDVPRGLVYVSDGPNHQVLVFAVDGTLQQRIGQFGLDTPQGLNFPTGVAVGPDGSVHVVDSGNAEVHVYDVSGRFLRVYGGPGENLGQFAIPSDVAVAADGGSYVADPISGWVTRFDAAGQPLDRFQPSFTDGQPIQPQYVALSPSGQLIVSGKPGFLPTT